MFFWVFSPASICNLPTFRNHVSVPSSKAGRLLPAFEDGTDTWFRNVGKLHTDAGEIPKKKNIYNIQITAKARNLKISPLIKSRYVNSSTIPDYSHQILISAHS